MPLDITFTLSDEDLERFQEIVDKAKTTVEDDETAAQVETAAREIIASAGTGNLPEFVAERFKKLAVTIDMINDEEWQLSQEERYRVLSALAYLCDPEDLIPDHVPGLGFLDDAIYAEVVIKALGNEISLFEEFCSFRMAEEARREAAGDDVHVGREEWLADKRAALHEKMRKRRLYPRKGSGWRMRLW